MTTITVPMPTGAKWLNLCRIENCAKRVHGHKLCAAHYDKYRKYGDPLASAKRASASERFWPKVEKTTTCWIWRAATTEGYGVIRINRKAVRAHRFAYEEAHGPVAPGMVIDHICHNRACVNPAHLRVTDDKHNGENRGGLNSNNTSGVRGVHWVAEAGKWEARTTHRRKVHIAGRFATIQEAEAAAIALRLLLFTHNDLDRRADADHHHPRAV